MGKRDGLWIEGCAAGTMEVVLGDEAEEASELVKIDIFPDSQALVALQVGIDCFDDHVGGS